LLIDNYAKRKNSNSLGVGVFFSRQDDRPGASNKQLAIAAWKGNRRFWFLGPWMLYAAGSKM